MTDERRLPDRVSAVSAELDDLLDSLREENEALLVRVAHLEATRDEYRRQMEGLLTSCVVAGHCAPADMSPPARDWSAAGSGSCPSDLRDAPPPLAFCTAGLFPPEVPPPGGLVTAASPLLAHPQLTTDRRQPSLEGSRSDARVLVVAHVYYPEVWFDIEDRLVRMPEPYDLVISLVEGRTEALEPEIASRLPRAMVLRVPNVGRDLGSLVELAGCRRVRRLRRDPQGAHEAKPAPDRRRRLAGRAAGRAACRRRRGSAASSSCCAATEP